MNIYEKLAAITAELNAVAKNLKVGEGRSAYKAVGEADVLAAVKPLEAKYRVYSYPAERRIVDSDVITTKKVYNGQESESSKFYMRLETVYRFVNTEDPEDYCEITTYGDGMDAGDKAPGKAMTYGDKYALLKAYKVITGDDPDQLASEESTVSRSGSGRFQRAEPAEPVHYCEDCTLAIGGVKRKDGSVITPAEFAANTKAVYGRQLCADCEKKARAARNVSAV